MPSRKKKPVVMPETAAAEVEAIDTESPLKPNFPIVGIGASAGGLAAFDAFFSGMPLDKEPTALETSVIPGAIAELLGHIMESKRAEKALRESEVNYRTLADSGQALIWTSKTDKLCDYFNKVWLNFTGRTMEEEFGNGWGEGVHPEDFQRCLDIYVTAFDKRETFSMDYRLRRHDGEYRWIQDDGCPRYNLNGSFIGYISYCLDVTERKEAEEKLGKSEQLFHSLVETSQDIIWKCDVEGRWTYLNLAAEQVFGYELDEMIGKKFFEFQTPVHAEHALTQFNRLLEGEAIWHFESTFIAKSGDEIHLVINAVIWTDGNDNIIGASGTAHDITERKRLEAELRQARADAETANHAKSGFLSTMSHEIRTPLSAMLGNIELLEGSLLTPSQQECLKDCKSASHILLRVINDVLDFSKIEAGKLELGNETFSVSSMSRQLVRMFSTTAKQKGLDLTISLADDLPEYIRCDQQRLRQIISNLLSNAIKFTRQGRVSLEITHEQGTKSTALLRIVVSDTGVGIPVDKHEYIFDSFTQVEDFSTRNVGGTGLGLPICRRLLALMGGSITVVSVPGEGSVFTVVLPVENCSAQAQARARGQAQAPSRNILLADDEEFGRTVAQKLLERKGYKVTAVQNGAELLADLPLYLAMF